MAAFGANRRTAWLLDPDITFLNHGSFGATPRRVLDAQTAWREQMERQPVRFMNQDLEPALRAAADRLAAFVGAPADGLVFVGNATEGVNAVMRSLAFGPGDEILTTDHAYPAVRHTLAHICKRTGADLTVAGMPFPAMDPHAAVDAIEDALSARTRIAVLDHVASHSAVVWPIADMIARCRDRGVPVLIDGAHGPGMLALDISSLDPDWYVGNCHKWLCAPKGCGFLWSAANRRDELHPAVISNPYGQGYWAEFGWTGTRDPTALLSVTAAIEFFAELDPAAARSYMRALANQAAERLASEWRTERASAPAMTAAMAAVRLPELDGATAGAIHDQLLDDFRIEVPVLTLHGANWVRISAQVYNEPGDYERLAAAIGALAARRARTM